ncbi:MAG: deoxyribonuclease IV, partial [Actinobacteria bacterium]|nr:deoxyribonuclease IV [Actinomycetota bacterium]
VQFFLTDPQAWKAPDPHPQAEEIKASGLTVYIHAPYRINVATTNNRIRVPSRKLLAQHAAGAAELGAKAIIVHGGHLGDGDDPAIGFDNWRKTFAYAQNDGGFAVPVLIENTAGGTNAMARRFDRLAALWDAVGEFGVGFCLDTCHAFAGGEDLSGIVDRVKAITGRIDLVHANDSRDAFDSGADRHANLGDGTIDPSVIADVCRAAGSDVIVETPGGAEGQGADVAYLRKSI